MKRLVWGFVLFFGVLASGTSQVSACDWKTMFQSDAETSSVITHLSGNTVVISSDEDFVTVVVYEGSHSEWI